MRGGVKKQLSSVGNSLINNAYFQKNGNVLRKKWGLKNAVSGFVAPQSFPPYRHFERKREIFFVGGKTVYACEPKREA